MTGCHGMESLDIEAKIICVEKINRWIKMYFISSKVDGIKLQIGAKSMSIVKKIIEIIE